MIRTLESSLIPWKSKTQIREMEEEISLASLLSFVQSELQLPGEMLNQTALSLTLFNSFAIIAPIS